MKNLLFILFFAIFLIGCEDEDPMDPENDPETSYVFFAKVDGNDYIDDEADHDHIGNQEFIDASRLDGDTEYVIRIALPETTDLGSHVVTGATDIDCAYIINENGSSTVFTSVSGELNLIENSEERIKATFSFGIAASTLNPEILYNITEGEFDILKD